jgi:DNA-binding transcriptional regulator GbsR (MarR family)
MRVSAMTTLRLAARRSLVSGRGAIYNFHIFLKGIKPMKTPQAEPTAQLEKVEDEFVELWNNMASLWGVSPTMARIHGLLYITGASLSMDDIMSRLGISRGNVSMNLSKLVEWALVRRVHKRGDRREYYESISDVWEMFTLVASQRKRREIDPILTTLRRCREELAPEALGKGPEHPAARERLARVNELFKAVSMMDRLAQRFFESQRSLREAFELLTQEDG